MQRRKFIFFIGCFVLLILGCSTEDHDLQPVNQSALNPVVGQSKKQSNFGATQISGVGFYAENADCDFTVLGADFALLLTGELEGCLYVFVESHDCSPSGTYREQGTELFIGTYNGEQGSFETAYKFEAKFEGCSEDGFAMGAEIFGRCQHPIVKGSGTGIFAGVSGRLDFKDDIETETFPYRGHLK